MKSKRIGYLIFVLVSGLLLSIISCNQDNDDDCCDNNYPNPFTDSRDGNEYSWVTLGNQIWMNKNMAYLPKVSPPDSGSLTSKNYYVYFYNGTSVSDAEATAYYQDYGVLYNWSAAMSDTNSIPNPDGVKGVCPTGWHMPGDIEWKELEMFLGLSQSSADSTG